MTRIFSVLFLFFIVLVSPLWAVDFPKPVGYVNDFASLYSETFRTTLNRQLQELETKTTIQFVVVTVNSLNGITIEEYANELFTAWAIGQKGQDNGILLLISKQDRQLRFEIGYGLEGPITDGSAGSIIRNTISPAFKSGDFEGGTLKGVNRVIDLVASGAIASPTPPPAPKLPFSFDTFWVVAIIFIYFISYMARTREFMAGGVVGFILGLIFFTLSTALVIALIGLILDFILSRNYKTNSSSGRPTDFFNTFGGFKGGGWGGGGGGGFSGGGGRSGGGGASGGW